ncbi:MATE family efflux transporter [Cereibacter sphaeroides]|jgi:MATE family multidrug resistance protein|uniref:MATE family efflux transporter n=1 Tax=Cereibacter sphaeroides TaxID=1063 RepID=UPI0000665544|nr:MATE family efflux transporter [Cereibacter sphaeroides]ABN77525.1 MATE efflux family protein [Cereibacter sphaeroides ATCC 17029]EKX59372.1 Multidrug and toxin extrusion (MATE) family efflux pump YdhE/NorM [Rhodobacter sp. AKP1]MWP36169.1 MATE family efflux transporter [Cereibacter sphaeroides]
MVRSSTFTSHARAILALGLPLVGSHLAQMSLHVTDTVMLGWYGVTELAAVVLGASLFFVTFILGSGFAQAVMPMVAEALGRGDETQVRRDTRMGLWLSIAFGLLVYPLFWFSGSILLALGQQPEVAALAQDYLRIAGLGMVPALLIMVLKSYLSALERTQIVLWATLAAVVVNAGLNWVLIFGRFGAPELGVEGAAIASVGAQIMSLAALGLYAALLPPLRRFNLFQRFWRPDWHALARVFALGWPIGFTGLAEGAIFQAAALMMGWIGTVPLAAHGIALEVTALAFMVHVGISNAATIRTGRADGAGNTEGLRDGAKVAILLSLGFGLVMVAIFLLFPGPIIALFLDRANPEFDEIVAFGSVLLAFAALFQIADAMQVIALGLLRGLRDTQVPMWLASFSYWMVGIPASYVLGFPMGLGGPGLWLGLVVGLTLAAILLMTRFWLRAPRLA